MPTPPLHTEPEHPRAEEGPRPAAAGGLSGSEEDRAGESPAPGGPAFRGRDTGAAPVAEPAKIRAGRYGELEKHELLHLLDSIEDERARGRFRESIYISALVYLALAWFIFYGPRVLWHAPRIKLASEAIREHEMATLIAPRIPHPPTVAPAPPPRVDSRTLEHLRAEAPPTPQPPRPTPQPAAQPAAPTPAPSTPAPATTMPEAPRPQPTPARPAPPVVAEAPTPQPSARPNFSTGSTSDNMTRLAREVPRGSGTGAPGVAAPLRGGGSMGSGSEILSDTQGVDFTAWQRRFERGTMNAWLPLIPEEVQPPLMKKGETYLIITILPDGTIGDMKLEASSHDDAINRSAWGSIVSQGKLPALPSAFHGPNIVIRVHYLVNMDRP